MLELDTENIILDEIEKQEVNYGKFICSKCSTYFTDSKNDYENHLRKSHADYEEVNCVYCTVNFDASAIGTHIESHFEENFLLLKICNLCNLSLKMNNQESVFNHLMLHHNNALVCPLCKTEFAESFQLIEHVNENMKTVYRCKFNGCEMKSNYQEELNSHQISMDHLSELCFKENTFDCLGKGNKSMEIPLLDSPNELIETENDNETTERSTTQTFSKIWPLVYRSSAFINSMEKAGKNVPIDVKKKLVSVERFSVGLTVSGGKTLYSCLECDFPPQISHWPLKKHIMVKHCSMNENEAKQSIMFVEFNRVNRKNGTSILTPEVPSQTLPPERKILTVKKPSEKTKTVVVYGIKFMKDLIGVVFKEGSALFEEIKTKLMKLGQFTIRMESISNSKFYFCSECTYKSVYSPRDVRKHIIIVHCRVPHKIASRCIRVTELEELMNGAVRNVSKPKNGNRDDLEEKGKIDMDENGNFTDYVERNACNLGELDADAHVDLTSLKKEKNAEIFNVDEEKNGNISYSKKEDNIYITDLDEEVNTNITDLDDEKNTNKSYLNKEENVNITELDEEKNDDETDLDKKRVTVEPTQCTDRKNEESLDIHQFDYMLRLKVRMELFDSVFKNMDSASTRLIKENMRLLNEQSIGVVLNKSKRNYYCLKCSYVSLHSNWDVRKHIIIWHSDISKNDAYKYIKLVDVVQEKVDRKNGKIEINPVFTKVGQVIKKLNESPKKPIPEVIVPIKTQTSIKMQYSEQALRTEFAKFTREFIDDLKTKLDLFKTFTVDVVHGMNSKNFKCTVCNYSSIHTQNDVRKHILVIHCGITNSMVRDVVKVCSKSAIQAEEKSKENTVVSRPMLRKKNGIEVEIMASKENPVEVKLVAPKEEVQRERRSVTNEVVSKPVLRKDSQFVIQASSTPSDTKLIVTRKSCPVVSEKKESSNVGNKRRATIVNFEPEKRTRYSTILSDPMKITIIRQISLDYSEKILRRLCSLEKMSNKFPEIKESMKIYRQCKVRVGRKYTSDIFICSRCHWFTWKSISAVARHIIGNHINVTRNVIPLVETSSRMNELGQLLSDEEINNFGWNGKSIFS